LHKLRQVRAGLSDWSARRKRLGRRRDGQAHRQHQFAGSTERSAGMKKVKVATVWLDGCSGCHMSLLDMDAAIISLARRIDIVYGPLVDAQEFPEDVDVTLVEGAVSSQDDMNKIQKIRARSHYLISLGDCAVTGNVPAMRNSVPVSKLLQRIYIEGVQENKVVPTDRVPVLLKAARPVREIVKVDLALPGCPPPSKTISGVLTDLLEGRKPETNLKVKFG
jgi:NAD-reducing hydrogenase small subunit